MVFRPTTPATSVMRNNPVGNVTKRWRPPRTPCSGEGPRTGSKARGIASAVWSVTSRIPVRPAIPKCGPAPIPDRGGAHTARNVIKAAQRARAAPSVTNPALRIIRTRTRSTGGTRIAATAMAVPPCRAFPAPPVTGGTSWPATRILTRPATRGITATPATQTDPCGASHAQPVTDATSPTGIRTRIRPITATGIAIPVTTIPASKAYPAGAVMRGGTACWFIRIPGRRFMTGSAPRPTASIATCRAGTVPWTFPAGFRREGFQPFAPYKFHAHL